LKKDDVVAVVPFCFALRWMVVVMMRRVEKRTLLSCFFLTARECHAIGLRVLRASIEVNRVWFLSKTIA
jgi:hypothetical protein